MLFCFSPKAEVDELRPVQQLKLKFQYFILFEMTHIVILILTRFSFKVGEGNGNPLQYSCLENPMDRGAWYASVYGVA